MASQPDDILGVGAFTQALDDALLDGPAGNEDISRLIDGGLGDEGTPVRHDRHQAIALQRGQCLSDAGPADGEYFGKLLFFQARSRP
ncbi:hypothetical protein D9M70_653960 [compost metagenome]